MKSFNKALQSFKEGDYGGALKQVQRQVKQVALDMSDLEVMVEEATSAEPWGPHGQLLNKIAKAAAISEENFRQIMGVLIDRILSAWKKPKLWRHAYKSLLVLEYLIKNGPEEIVGELTEDESMDIFHRLESFQYVDTDMKDYGLNVRKRAGDIALLLSDPERITQERAKAEENKSKLKGYGNSSSSQSGWSKANSNAPWKNNGNDAQLYETENKAAWGSGKFRSGATLVRSKDSFSKPVQTYASYSDKGSGSSSIPTDAIKEVEKEIDLLGLDATDNSIGKSQAQVVERHETLKVPSPTKIDGIMQEKATSKTGENSKGKAKVLSQTKVNPKIQSMFKGFKHPNTSDTKASLLDGLNTPPVETTAPQKLSEAGTFGVPQVTSDAVPVESNWAAFEESSPVPNAQPGIDVYALTEPVQFQNQMPQHPMNSNMNMLYSMPSTMQRGANPQAAIPNTMPSIMPGGVYSQATMPGTFQNSPSAWPSANPSAFTGQQQIPVAESKANAPKTDPFADLLS